MIGGRVLPDYALVELFAGFEYPMTQISSPNNAVLVLGRVLVESDSDLATAYDLSKQIQLTPLSGWQPSQYIIA